MKVSQTVFRPPLDALGGVKVHHAAVFRDRRIRLVL
jgi:hypothetical protein